MTETTVPALWIAAPGIAELRPTRVAAAGPGEVRVRVRHSGISRGTERLVFEGRVPESEAQRMRCPLQEGAFPGPVKYGYVAVGEVEAGPPALAGRTVFLLAPHQSVVVAPSALAVPLPEGLPARRAVLGANMETALNILWDAAVGPADRVAVIGAGVVGLLVASLAAAVPGTETTVVDVDPAKAAIARRLGLAFAGPDRCPSDCDVVIDTSAAAAGLALALEAAGDEATVIEASWFGAAPVAVPLGAAFHSRRLTLRSSQVGAVSPSRRPRWPHRRRLAAALRLLADPRYDALISGETPFADAARDYPRILTSPDTLAHIFTH